MDPNDMTEEQIQKLHKGAEDTARIINDKLINAGADGPFGQLVLTLALSMWLAYLAKDGKLKNDDLQGTLEANILVLREWTELYFKEATGRG